MRSINFNDIKGTKVHSLTFVSDLGIIENGRGALERMLLCKCDCGSFTVISFNNRLKTKTCGCLLIRKGSDCQFYKHGEKGTKLYTIWNLMLDRCRNENNPSFKDYGARGIFVCKEWAVYENFREWAFANGYKEGLSIERDNVNLGYSPQNCSWIPYSRQNWNKRNTVYLEYNGIKKPIIYWVEIIGGNRTQVERRLSNRYHRKWQQKRIFTGYENKITDYINSHQLKSA
jgi:hypothetical protein